MSHHFGTETFLYINNTENNKHTKNDAFNPLFSVGASNLPVARPAQLKAISTATNSVFNAGQFITTRER